ncbi:MAG: glycerophosphodiester phosphodiesterase [Brumimicrobium sp.]|nr:glycerophosphodiester phosphodiesterase [Brumimicrobium sp.]
MIEPEKIVAHRGAWKDFNLPQNSIQAFLKAQELPIGGIEFDLQYTKDGKIIVHHDDEYRGRMIYQKHYLQLKGLQVLTKESVLSFKKIMKYWEGEKSLWIELKPSGLNDKQKVKFVQKVIQTIGDRLTNIYFISFDLLILKELQKHTVLPCLYLGSDATVDVLLQEGINGLDVEYVDYMNAPELLLEAKKHQLITNAWTVNDLEIAQKLSAMGIDFITTDKLLLLIGKE